MTTREQHMHMARVYLHQARCTKHRAWRFTLMQWAADRRLKAAGIKPEIAKQADLFGDDMKHTPGPWVIHERTTSKTVRINGKDGTYITQRDFTTNSKQDQERIIADCRLIAAAPELYEALEKMLDYYGSHTAKVECQILARAALAKARGE